MNDCTSNRGLEMYYSAITGIANVYWTLGSIDIFNKYTQKGLMKAKKCRHGTRINSFNMMYSEYLFSLGQHEDALNMYNSILPKLSREGNIDDMARCMSNIGYVLSRLGKYQNEIKHYRKALKLYHKAGNKSGEAHCLNNIATYYYKMNQLNNAHSYFNAALKIFKSNNHLMGVALCLNNLGALHHKKGKLKKSLIYFKESLSIREKIGYKSGIALLYNNIGSIYGKLNDEKNYEMYLKKSMNTFIQVNDNEGMILAMSNLAKLHIGNDDLSKAFKLLREAYSIARDSNHRNNELICAEGLTELYVKKRQWKKALFMTLQMKKICEETGSNEHLFRYEYSKLMMMHQKGIKEKNKKKIINKAEKLLQMANEMNQKPKIGLVHFLMAQLYYATNEFKLANTHLKKAYGIFRESGNTTMKLKAKTLRKKYDKSEQNMKMNINYQEDI